MHGNAGVKEVLFLEKGVASSSRMSNRPLDTLRAEKKDVWITSLARDDVGCPVYLFRDIPNVPIFQGESLEGNHERTLEFEQIERKLNKPWLAHVGTLQSPLRSPGQVRVDDWHTHLNQQEIFAMGMLTLLWLYHSLILCEYNGWKSLNIGQQKEASRKKNIKTEEKKAGLI